MKVESVINEINRRPSLGFVILGILYNFAMQGGLVVTIGTSMTGFMPYTQWECLRSSNRCLAITEGGKTYTRETFCNTTLQLNRDFVWKLDGRTSFAIDYDLLCDREYLYNLCNTFFFIGAMLALPIGGQLIDFYGRKPGVITSLLISIVGIGISIIPSPNVAVLILGRVIVGAGSFILISGVNTYVFELSPSKYRPVACFFVTYSWAAGYFVMVGSGYLIKMWQLLSLVPIAFFLVALVTTICIPESPKFTFLTKRNVAKAKAALQWFQDLNGTNVNLESLSLGSDNSQDDKQKLSDYLKDLIKHKALLIQTVVFCFQYLATTTLYYGFAFSWSKLSSNLYIGYLFAGLGEFLAQTMLFFPLTFMARRHTVMLFYISGGISILLTLLPHETEGDKISVHQIVSILGSMLVTVGWNAIIVQMIEAAPTTHRALIQSLASSSGRVGSILGTQVGLLLEWNESFTMIIFGVVAIAIAVCGFFMPETKGIVSPQQPDEVAWDYTGKSSNKPEKQLLTPKDMESE